MDLQSLCLFLRRSSPGTNICSFLLLLQSSSSDSNFFSIFFRIERHLSTENVAEPTGFRTSLCMCNCCVHAVHFVPNRQSAHGLQIAEIAQYKKRKAATQQEQLAKKKNWGNVMHYQKMYNITGLVGNMTRPLANTVQGLVEAWTVSRCHCSLFAFWTWPSKKGGNLGHRKTQLVDQYLYIIRERDDQKFSILKLQMKFQNRISEPSLTKIFSCFIGICF